MAEDKIDSLLERKKISKEFSDTSKEAKNLLATIQQLKKAGMIDMFNVKDTGQYAKLRKDLDAISKELEKSIKRVKELEAQIAKGIPARTKSNKLTLEEKIANQEALKVQKERIKLRNAEEGSYSQLNLQYQKAVRILNNLNQEQKQTDRGKALEKFAKEAQARLKEMDARVLSFRRNVGNYANSLADGFELVAKEIEKLKVKQQGLVQMKAANPLGFDANRYKQDLDDTNTAIDRLTKTAQIGFQTNKSFDATVKELQKDFSNLAASGQVSNEFLEEYAKHVAAAKDQSEDLKAEIKALASDTRQLDLLVGSISALASGIELAAGVSQLFGVENENIEKSLQKLVAIQTVANGVRELGKQITERGTAANKAYNFVIEQGSILFGKGSTAAQRFQAALKGIIIVAVIGFLIGLIKYLTDTGDSAKNVEDRFKKLNDELERHKNLIKDLSDDAAEDADENIARIKRENQARLAGAKTEEERLKISNENRKRLYNAEVKAKQDQIKALEQNKKDADEEEIRQEFRINKELEELNKQGINKISKERADAYDKTIKTVRENAANIKKELGKAYQELVNLQIEGQTELAEGEDELAKLRAEAAKELLLKHYEAQFEQARIDAELQADISSQILDDEKASTAARINALEEYLTYKQELISLNAAQERSAAKGNADQLKTIAAKQYADEIRLAIEAREKLLSILSSRVIDQEKVHDTEVIATDKFYKSLADRLKQYNQEKKKLEDESDKDRHKRIREALKDDEEYQNKKKDLAKQLTQELIDLGKALFTANLERQKNELEDQKNGIDDRLAAEIEATNRSGLSQEERTARIIELEKKAAIEKERLDRRQRQLSQEQARFEKAASVANIIAKTAEAIIGFLAKPGGPAGITLSILAGAIGAAQLARVIATPIPKYAEGTDNHPGGLFIAGDNRKHEVVIEPSGKTWQTADTPTLYTAPKNSIVLPDVADYNGFIQSTIKPPREIDRSEKLTPVLKKGFKDVVSAVNKKPVPEKSKVRRWDIYMNTSKGFINGQ